MAGISTTHMRERAAQSPPKKKVKRVVDASAIIKHSAKLSRSNAQSNTLKSTTAVKNLLLSQQASKSAVTDTSKQVSAASGRKGPDDGPVRLQEHHLSILFAENTSELRESVYEKTSAELDTVLEELLAALNGSSVTENSEDELGSSVVSKLLQAKLDFLSESLDDTVINIASRQKGTSGSPVVRTTTLATELASFTARVDAIDKEATELQKAHRDVLHEIYWIAEAVFGEANATSLFKELGYGQDEASALTQNDVESNTQFVGGSSAAAKATNTLPRSHSDHLWEDSTLVQSSPCPITKPDASSSNALRALRDSRQPFLHFPPPSSKIGAVPKIGPSGSEKMKEFVDETAQIKRDCSADFEAIEKESELILQKHKRAFVEACAD